MQNYMPNGQISYKNANAAPQSQVQPQYIQPQTPNPAPNYAGVNIQIINPMVNPAGGYIYPPQSGSAYETGTNGGCYPSSYYTTQPGTGLYQYPQNMYQPPAQVNPAGDGAGTTAPSGFYDSTGRYYPYVKDSEGNIGYYDNNGQFHRLNSVNDPINNSAEPQEKYYDKSGKAYDIVKDNNGKTGYYDENGAFHETVKDENGNYKLAENKTSDLNDETSDKSTDNIDGENIKNKTADDSVTKTDTDLNKDKDSNKIGYEDENGKIHESATNEEGKTGFYDENGKFREVVTDKDGKPGYYDENNAFHPVNRVSDREPKDDVNKKDSQRTDNNTVSEKSTEKITEKENSKETDDKEKTVKKKVVALTNDYIKTVENYLNSQDLEIRKMGAHEVVDRLIEDPSRKDDPALTALINKMLQDPSSAIRAIALSMVESRTVSGDDKTVNILKNMQQLDDGLGLDATQATSALLKMAGKTVEKEVPVTEINDSQKKGGK